MLSGSLNNKILFVIIFTLFMTVLPACGQLKDSDTEPITKTKFMLDTICSITLYDTSDDEIIDQCFQKIDDIEEKMSVNLAESEVSKINQNAGISPVKVSEDTYQVIRTGIKYSEMTSGRFDISVGPLVKLWGINTPDQKIPAETAVESAVALIDYRKIKINDADKSVFLKEKGMLLDLGGIAKGYAGDAVAEILRKKGVHHAIVDLGGNLAVIGSKPDGTNWNVGIQTPFEPNGDYFAVLNISDEAVVTSGIYQRYFVKNKKIYHHIMNTKTGYPVDNGLVSATVVCRSSMDADALAKVFTLGLEKGMEFIENQKEAEAVFVTDKNEVYSTPGLKGLLKITDDKYKLVEQ